jgi:ESCRT-II complex subunit VPS36
MEFLKWSNGKLNQPEEEVVHEQTNVSVYDLNEKTGFQAGLLKLTSHRLIWTDKNDPYCIVQLDLSPINRIELKQVQNVGASRALTKQQQTFPRIILYLDKSMYKPTAENITKSLPRQVDLWLQFEFEYGGHNEFSFQLGEQLNRKKWSYAANSNQIASSFQNIGITGIQRKMQDCLNQQDQKIHDSFRDLSVLMNQAKEMVTLSNSIIGKLTAKMNATASNSTAENTDEDQEEMKKLKSYFMNMGLIDNPVTKETSGSKYHKDLALEIHNTFGEFIAHNGGIMTLADVYCRLNRARAIAGLVSPEDLFMACKQLNKLNLTLKYNVYSDLNLHVLEITQENNRKLQEIIQLVRSNECLTAYKLSKMINCSLIVAKKYLLDGERIGALCRDDTNSGLQFYSNLFALKEQTSF